MKTILFASVLLAALMGLAAAGPNDLKPYSPPIGVSMHPILAVSLTSVGLAFLGLLVTQLIPSDKKLSQQRSLATELVLAAGASFFLGFGGLFVFLWTGVWV
eukprot:TRINITY_DN14531_c0_g1_i1.p1 TRINITY_DN14531_c0_g1~~TRINITY_DN14531_c0_g1_i1.p1  ORF type:complete len:115 (+),score=27.94 TRINITY_DN14531_c0_g1_i1:41-346(+)